MQTLKILIEALKVEKHVAQECRIVPNFKIFSFDNNVVEISNSLQNNKEIALFLVIEIYMFTCAENSTDWQNSVG